MTWRERGRQQGSFTRLFWRFQGSFGGDLKQVEEPGYCRHVFQHVPPAAAVPYSFRALLPQIGLFRH